MDDPTIIRSADAFLVGARIVLPMNSTHRLIVRRVLAFAFIASVMYAAPHHHHYPPNVNLTITHGQEAAR